MPPGGLYRAVWLVMTAMTVFFLALVYAYLERRRIAEPWFTGPLIGLLGCNTGLLLGSSAALDAARRALRRDHIAATLRWLTVALALGATFLLGQATAWRLLLEAGVYLRQYPDSGFFYLLTAAHAVHLCAALGLMIYVFSRAWRGRLRPDRMIAMDLTAIVWHTLDATWVYIFLVLLLWR